MGGGGHLGGRVLRFCLHSISEGKQGLAKRVTRLRCSSVYEIANSPLTASACCGDLGLRQVAKFLDLGDDVFPVHRMMITSFRYYASGFPLSLSPRL